MLGWLPRLVVWLSWFSCFLLVPSLPSWRKKGNTFSLSPLTHSHSPSCFLSLMFSFLWLSLSKSLSGCNLKLASQQSGCEILCRFPCMQVCLYLTGCISVYPPCLLMWPWKWVRKWTYDCTYVQFTCTPHVYVCACLCSPCACACAQTYGHGSDRLALLCALRSALCAVFPFKSGRLAHVGSLGFSCCQLS